MQISESVTCLFINPTFSRQCFLYLWQYALQWNPLSLLALERLVLEWTGFLLSWFYIFVFKVFISYKHHAAGSIFLYKNWHKLECLTYLNLLKLLIYSLHFALCFLYIPCVFNSFVPPFLPSKRRIVIFTFYFRDEGQHCTFWPG